MATQRELVLEYLRDKPKGAATAEIAAHLGIPAHNVTARLSELAKQNFVKNTKPGGPGHIGHYEATDKKGSPVPPPYFYKKKLEERTPKKALHIPQEASFRKRSRRGDLQALREQIAALNQMLLADFGVELMLRLEQVEGKPQLRAVVQL